MSSEARQSYEALQSWLKSFDEYREGWMRPRGLEVDVADLFNVMGRVTASVLAILEREAAINEEANSSSITS